MALRSVPLVWAEHRCVLADVFGWRNAVAFLVWIARLQGGTSALIAGGVEAPGGRRCVEDAGFPVQRLSNWRSSYLGSWYRTHTRAVLVHFDHALS
jgi:hypothetical protein